MSGSTTRPSKPLPAEDGHLLAAGVRNMMLARGGGNLLAQMKYFNVIYDDDDNNNDNNNYNDYGIDDDNDENDNDNDDDGDDNRNVISLLSLSLLSYQNKL